MKKIILFIFINLLLFNGTVSAATDCTNPENSKKFKCKISSKIPKISNKDKTTKSEKKKLFKTPKFLKKINTWNKENSTLKKMTENKN